MKYIEYELNKLKAKFGIEVWKDITGYEGYFQVSNLGRLRSLTRTIVDRNGVVKEVKGCLKGLNRKTGYQRTVLYKDGIKGKGMSVHRLVSEAFIPNPENKPQVNHIDGNKLNNNLYNLEWCTASENSQWSYDIGLQLKGENHSQAKLTNDQVIEICNLIDTTDLTKAEISRKFNVDPVTVRDIHFGKVWNHLTNRKGKFKLSSRKGPEHVRSKSVINCRGEVFNTITEAVEKYGTSTSLISKCCRELRLHSGKYEDGSFIKWRYYKPISKANPK